MSTRNLQEGGLGDSLASTDHVGNVVAFLLGAMQLFLSNIVGREKADVARQFCF